MEALSYPHRPVTPAAMITEPVNDSRAFDCEMVRPGPAPGALLPALDDEQTVLSLYPWLD